MVHAIALLIKEVFLTHLGAAVSVKQFPQEGTVLAHD